MKVLTDSGISILWNKIKNIFLTKEDEQSLYKGGGGV